MPQYPGTTASDSNLFVAVNNLSTTLNGAIDASVTTITVTSTTGFPTTGYITIELEAISYTGVTGTQFTGCTRGADGTTAASHADATQVFHNIVAAHHNVLKDETIAVETDLRNTFASITPVTAADTATSHLQRIAHIVSQIKAIAGTTNWYDSIAVSLLNKLSLAGGTMSGAIAMGTNKITGLGNGTAAQDAAAFGQLKVVQFQVATSTTGTSTTSSTFQNTNLSVSITPTSASNRILLFAVGHLESRANNAEAEASLFRDSTNLQGAQGQAYTYANTGTTISSLATTAALIDLDSPATTSATTYSVKLRSVNGTATVGWSVSNATTQTIIAVEVV